MKFFRILTYCLILLATTSCYTRRCVGLLQERKNLPEYEKGLYQEYRLRKNDEIVFRLITSNNEAANMFGAQTSTNAGQNGTTYRIFEDGTLDIPFISHIPVEGMTLTEAEDFLCQQIKPYVPDAQVKLALATSTFCVIGDAGRGYYGIYKERMTIYQALAECGGLNESGDHAHVKIIRESNDGTKIESFDIRSRSLIESEFYYVYPNDIIYVDVTKKNFWAVNSYSGFLGVITSSLSLMLTVWNLVIQYSGK